MCEESKMTVSVDYIMCGRLVNVLTVAFKTIWVKF